MRFSIVHAVTFGLTLCLAQDLGESLPENDTDIVIPEGFILEYSPDAHLKSKRDEILSQDDIRVVKSFDSAIFSGVQIETSKHDLDTLAALPGVVRVWPDQRVELTRPITKRETRVSPDHADDHLVHWATGVDKLHERGILGKGVKVGIVDTGVWYRHAALGAGFGSGFKVAGGWDLVGDGWVAGQPLKPDADPLDEQAHGTHVAGIVAGHSVETGWKGVAPEASIYSYKVFGPNDGTSESVIIAAFIKAYEEGMDVITASIGGAGGFADNAWATVASRLVDEGVVVIVAAGNSGQAAPFYASSGAAGAQVVAVASVDVVKTNSTESVSPSSFTSWGGLYDLSVKPDIAGPGRMVFSTWSGGNDNEFALESGTSMAAPYIAGVAALYISQHGGRSVHGKAFGRDLAMRIISSGTTLGWKIGSPVEVGRFKAPTHQVGTGLVNALKVLDNTISAELERFALNDTRRTRRHQSVTVRNNGKTRLSFTFELEAGAGFEMLKTDDGLDFAVEYPRIKYSAEMSPIEAVPGIQLPAKFELGPGTSSSARFVFDAPKGLNATALAAYGGKVIVKASNGESFSVPYQGLAFDLANEMKNIYVGTYPWLRAGMPPKDTTERVPHTSLLFTLNRSTAVQSYPKIFSKIKWGTREIRYDIYESGFAERHWRYPPVVGEFGYLGSATWWPYATQVSMFTPARHNHEETLPFPIKNRPRNGFVNGGYIQSYYWFGKLANGTYLPPGKYTVRFATLRPFSEPARSDSWATLTKEITFTGEPSQ